VRELTHSEFLKEMMLESMAVEGMDPLSPKFDEHNALFLDIAKLLMESRQSLNVVDPAELEAKMLGVSSDFLRQSFDYLYTTEMLNRIPKMVGRTLRFSSLVVSELPSTTTNLYLREATRCFVFGLWRGCMALCRSALEHGLRKQVTKKMGQAPSALTDLIKVATQLGLLDDAHATLAHRIRKIGNEVLHDEDSGDSEALTALDSTRWVLLHLFK
jgi:hypothetical protein